MGNCYCGRGDWMRIVQKNELGENIITVKQTRYRHILEGLKTSVFTFETYVSFQGHGVDGFYDTDEDQLYLQMRVTKELLEDANDSVFMNAWQRQGTVLLEAIKKKLK